MADFARIGLDLGTKTIVCATRDPDGKPKFRQEINGFFVLPKQDAFTKNMLIQQKIAYIERDGKFIALGARAEKFAYAINSTLRRPMAEGTISSENEAITIMASIVQALLGKLEQDTVLYYCIPADALNKKTNVGLHDKIAKLIFDSYKRTTAKISAYPINEARAIAVATDEPIALSCSFGAGMVNVCYSLFGVSIFEFSLVGAGDWIDTEAAKQFGYDPERPNGRSQETPTSICHRKQELDLSKPLGEMGRVDQSIMMCYQLLIEHVIDGIVAGFNDNIDRARIEQPIPIVMAGGTASPPGFKDYFERTVKSRVLPFVVSEVKMAERPLYCVSEGCLKAAEMHEIKESI